MRTVEQIAGELAGIEAEMQPHKESLAELNGKAVTLSAELRQAMGIAGDFEGTIKAGAGRYSVKVTQRMNRRIDGEQVQQIARDRGIDWQTVNSLFRWKPEVNLKVWRKTAPELTGLFAEAITTTPAKPTVKVEEIEG